MLNPAPSFAADTSSTLWDSLSFTSDLLPFPAEVTAKISKPSFNVVTVGQAAALTATSTTLPGVFYNNITPTPTPSSYQPLEPPTHHHQLCASSTTSMSSSTAEVSFPSDPMAAILHANPSSTSDLHAAGLPSQPLQSQQQQSELGDVIVQGGGGGGGMVGLPSESSSASSPLTSLSTLSLAHTTTSTSSSSSSSSASSSILSSSTAPSVPLPVAPTAPPDPSTSSSTTSVAITATSSTSTFSTSNSSSSSSTSSSIFEPQNAATGFHTSGSVPGSTRYRPSPPALVGFPFTTHANATLIGNNSNNNNNNNNNNQQQPTQPPRSSLQQDYNNNHMVAHSQHQQHQQQYHQHQYSVMSSSSPSPYSQHFQMSRGASSSSSTSSSSTSAFGGGGGGCEGGAGGSSLSNSSFPCSGTTPTTASVGGASSHDFVTPIGYTTPSTSPAVMAGTEHHMQQHHPIHHPTQHPFSSFHHSSSQQPQQHHHHHHQQQQHPSFPSTHPLATTTFHDAAAAMSMSMTNLGGMAMATTTMMGHSRTGPSSSSSQQQLPSPLTPLPTGTTMHARPGQVRSASASSISSVTGATGGGGGAAPAPAKMDDFYDQLLSLSFDNSADAIAKCRDLAREHGFTVKQETSSNKNVYLYCSREGVPDSVKNNKEIKRKRLSMRCDCKWRITLFQQESKQWVFRKAMNPASMVHNHPLISPDDIRQPWPPAVFERIAFYANQRNQTTAETRERIKEEFPDLVWDERRFYNRLTEERKQIKLRDSESRVFSTMDLAAKVASLASADPTLSYKVTSSLEHVLVEICEQLRIDPAGASSRVITSPSSSAGGGVGVAAGAGMAGGAINNGSSGSLGAAMSMTSPTSASPNYPSSSANSPLSSSDYVVTYPGCVISVKNTPTQKGRPSSTSSPIVDPSLAVGLGMSPLNDRKRSLSEECFTRQGMPPPPGSSTAFGIGASHMMTSLDGSMQQLAQQQQQQQQQQHTHASHLSHHHHSQQQQQQHQLQHQSQPGVSQGPFSSVQQSSLPPQPPQQQASLQQHAAHSHSLAGLDQSLVSGTTNMLVLPQGTYSSGSHASHSSPSRHALHHGHSQAAHTFSQSSMGFHPAGTADPSSPSVENPFDGSESHLGGHPGLTTIKRSHSVEIKQEVQPYFQQLLPALVPQRRSGGSPGPGAAAAMAGAPGSGPSSNRMYPGGQQYAQPHPPSSTSSATMAEAASTASLSAVPPYSGDVFTSSSGFPTSSEPYTYGSQPQYPTA